MEKDSIELRMKLVSILKFFLVFKNLLTLALKFVFERVSLYKRHFLRGILIGLIISVVVTTLAWLGHFKSYEKPLTDFLQYITQKKATDVVLLFITEKEYKQGFHSISPISRKRLAEVIYTLVKLKARVIALDIDISDPTPEDHKLSDAIDHASAAGIPVVVPANLKYIDEKAPSDRDSFADTRPYLEENLSHTRDGLLLFKDVSPGRQWVNEVMYGGVIFRLDPEGIFREAEALYMVEDTDSRNKISFTPVPSFPVAVASAYQGMSQEAIVEALFNFHDRNIILFNKKGHYQPEIHIHLGKGGRIIPNFIGNYKYFDREINLTRLLEEYGSGKPEGVTIFKDKVVIVGGVYDKKDFYITPVGRMSGMEVLGNITQNIISGSLITHTNFYKAFVIEVILGTMISLIFILISRIWATVICLVTLVPVVVTASLISFSNSYHWFDFVPTIAGVIMHGWVRRVEEEIKRLKYKVFKSG